MWAHVTYSDTGTPSFHRLCWLWNGIGDYAVTDIKICAQDSAVHLNFDNMPATYAGLLQISEPCLKFCHKYSILPRQSACQIGLANKRCWICDDTTQNICRQLSCAHELDSNGSKSCGFSWNQQVGALYSDTASHYCHHLRYYQIGLPNWIAKSSVRDLSERDWWHMARIFRRTWKWFNYATFTLLTSKGVRATGFRCT